MIGYTLICCKCQMNIMRYLLSPEHDLVINDQTLVSQGHELPPPPECNMLFQKKIIRDIVSFLIYPINQMRNVAKGKSGTIT